ncbi:response regulator transcription factor [Paraburkholderia sp. DHOC27]|uniref:response regulator transcription factor n=1 Tax=Paraburkholderia sp. DHOC27 TaxID=2303330 RepID=UPI000E3DC40E|nr:response regulator [Paraburkholderia sp. DHOC27]RFU49183.1 response regulator [Paraburkholderia sp. DHOC27]
MKTRLLVSVVDDDESVRESLPDLVRELGFEARAFESAEAFLASGCGEQTSCLILDVMMPGMSGLDLASELRARGMHIPIIFITANHNGLARTQLQDSGAVTCLYKPFSDVDLSEALGIAVQQH